MRPKSHISLGLLFLTILTALVLAAAALCAASGAAGAVPPSSTPENQLQAATPAPLAAGGSGAAPVSASATNGPPGLLAGPWPAMRGPFGTGLSPFKGPEKPKVKWVVPVEILKGPEKPKVKWVFRKADLVSQTPLIAADGTIYTFEASRRSIAVNALSPEGRRKWQLEVPASFPKKAIDTICVSPCLTADGTIYLHADDQLCAIAPDGQAKWKTRTGAVEVSIGRSDAQVAGPAVSRDGTAYLAVLPQQLLAVGPDGAVKWTAALTGAPRGSPVVSPDGTVYVAARAGEQYLVSAFTPSGELKWQVPFPNEYLQSLTVDRRGVLYVVLNNTGSVYAVGPDGVVRWHWVVPGTPRDWDGRKDYLDRIPPIIDGDGAVYVSYVRRMRLASVNPDGSAGRTASTWSPFGPFSRPDASSLVLDSAGVLYRVEPWGSLYGSEFATVPPYRGVLHAFTLDGKGKWSVEATAVLNSDQLVIDNFLWEGCAPAIGADGTLYVTSLGLVIAIGEDKP